MSSRNPSSSTFRHRLTVSMTLLSIAVLAAASTAIYLRVRQALLSHLDSTLLSIARVEVASGQDQPGGRIHVHDEPPTLSSPIGSGYEKFVQIKDGAHRVQAQTANLGGGPPLETDREQERLALQGQLLFTDMRRADQVYRAVYYPSRDATGGPLVTIVAIPKDPVRRSLDSLLRALVLAMGIGASMAAFGANRLASRLTRPLEEIAAAADAIGATNLQARIPDVSADVELRQVTRVLNQMLIRLEAAFAAQRNFEADASHELRSPLANLRGTVEVALRRPRSAEEYREALGVALTEAERLTRLVNDLLMLSRVESHHLHLDLQACDLAEIADAAVTAVSAQAREKGVSLRLDAEPAPTVGDADRLQQAVGNLLDNALRYAPAGSEVQVRTHRELDHVSLSVKDTGPGLSEEAQSRIFDRFYRADLSRARESGGLGLGLPITKAILEAHQGRISVRSEPGEGCLFNVVLPSG